MGRGLDALRRLDREGRLRIVPIPVPKSRLTIGRNIETAADAEAFLRDCLSFFGDGFHPDTAGAQYAAFDPDRPGWSEPTFGPVQARRFDGNMEAVFAVLADPYDVANRLAGEPGGDVTDRLAAPLPQPERQSRVDGRGPG
jgi:hypothetical protein